MKDEDAVETIIDLDDPGITESRCEFCGNRYWIDSDKCTTMHEHPSCSVFDALDALSFVVENNKIKEKKRKNRPQA
jgi:hypothetical protein